MNESQQTGDDVTEVTQGTRRTAPGAPADIMGASPTQTDDDLGEEFGADDENLPEPEQEATGEDGDDGAADQGVREVEVSDAELDTPVKFSDGTTLTLRELREGHSNQIDRQAWLQKTNALANAKKQYETVTARLQKLAETKDIPHAHMGAVLTEWAEAGLIPVQLVQDIDALWREYEGRGEYDGRRILQNAELQRERQILESQRGQVVQAQAEQSARSDMQSIAREFGEQTHEVKQAILSLIEQNAARDRQVSVRQAFDYLRQNGHIKVARVASPSAAKIQQRIKSRTIGRPTHGSAAPASKDDLAQELWDSLHKRR